MGRYVIILTSVYMADIITCAGTYAPGFTAAPAMPPLCMGAVLSFAAPHMTITAALMDWIMMDMLLILTAQEGHLPTRMRSVKTVTSGIWAPPGVTTPIITADY